MAELGEVPGLLPFAAAAMEEDEEGCGESCSTAAPPLARASEGAGSGACGSRGGLHHSRTRSCPAALQYSLSSSNLTSLDAMEEDQASTPPTLSPALQASMAALQSATSLLQELQFLQHEPLAVALPACAPSPPAAPVLLLGTPKQGGEAPLAPLQPTWLQPLLAVQPAPYAASSPQRMASLGGELALAPPSLPPQLLRP